MGDLTQSLPSSAPIRKEHKVFITDITDTDAAPGTVTYEPWRKHRAALADGPAFILRGAAISPFTNLQWYKDGKRIEPPADAKPAPAPG